MDTPALLPKRLVSKKWDQAMLCLVENALCQRLTKAAEWKIDELKPITKQICKALPRMHFEVVSSIKVLNLSLLELGRGETCDELVECLAIPFVATKGQPRSRNASDTQGTAPSLGISLVLDDVPFQPPKLLRTLKSIGSNLVGLSLNGDRTTLTDENFVKEIAHLDGLKELALIYCQGITAATLKEIAKLPQLRSLNLTAAFSLPDGRTSKQAPIQTLTTLRTLEELVLSDVTKISDAQVLKLSGALVKLKALDFSYCAAITNKSCEAIAKLPCLQTLKLHRCRDLTDTSLKALSSVATLTELDVTFIQVTDEGMKHVAKLTNLKVLDVSCCRSLTDDGIVALAPLANLETFRAAQTMLGDAGLSSLTQSCPNLSELQLCACRRISDLGVATLSRLQHLKILGIDGNTAITDASVQLFGSMRSLTALNLSECSAITNAGVSGLAESVALELLYLDRCNVSDVRPLAKVSTLKFLHLANTNIRDDSLQALAAQPKLETLVLEGCRSITDRGALELPKMKKLVHLSLQGVLHLTDKSGKMLSSLSDLKFLLLGRSGRLSDATLLKLSSLPKLCQISIAHLHVTDAGVSELAKIKTLKTIDLTGCESVSERTIKNLEKQKIEVLDMLD